MIQSWCFLLFMWEFASASYSLMILLLRDCHWAHRNALLHLCSSVVAHSTFAEGHARRASVRPRSVTSCRLGWSRSLLKLNAVRSRYQHLNAQNGCGSLDVLSTDHVRVCARFLLVDDSVAAGFPLLWTHRNALLHVFSGVIAKATVCLGSRQEGQLHDPVGGL